MGDSLAGECPYCGCRVEFRRISSFNGISRTNDLGNLRKLFESACGQSGNGNKHNSDEKNNLSLALCYLLAENYLLAKKKLAAVIEEEPSEPEPYYYYALTLIGGRSLTVLTMREAKTIIGYLQTAMSLDEKFVFPKLLYALICIEYYEANCLRSPANGAELLQQLYEVEVDPSELECFKSLVKTDVI